MEWGRLAILLAVVAVLVAGAAVYIVRHPSTSTHPAPIREPLLDKQATERLREWERWRRGGPLHQESLACRDLPLFVRRARHLPDAHDEALFHD